MSTPASAADSAAAQFNEIKQTALSLGLEEIDTHTAIDSIAQDILLKMYTYPSATHPELTAAEERRNAMIRKVYTEWNHGAEWHDDPDPVPSTMLLGPPGQGKTTAFREAAKKVAAAMQLKFVDNPSDDYRVTEEDFLFVSQEFSAENSKISLTGIPAKMTDEVDGITYMTQLVNRRLASLRKAGGGLLLLDDFPNASPNIQNVGLSLTEEGRFQGLGLQGVYVGVTGNLGSVDGTHTGRLSTALRSRCQIYFTQDHLGNFLARERRKFRDDVGLAGIDGFLERYEQYFMVMPNTKQSGGFETSRTWSKTIIETRRAIHRNGGNAQKALPEIRRKASSHIGLEAGQAFYTYMNSLMLNADPLAKEVITEGRLDREKLEERFKDGFSADQQHFAYQYAVALADYTVRKIVKDGASLEGLDLANPTKEAANQALLAEKMETAIGRFAMGVMPLNMDMFTFSLDNLKSKLANAIDEISIKHGPNGRQLTTEAKKAMVKIVARTKGFTVDHKEAMIESLTDADKYEQTSRLRKRRQAGN